MVKLLSHCGISLPLDALMYKKSECVSNESELQAMHSKMPF